MSTLDTNCLLHHTPWIIALNRMCLCKREVITPIFFCYLPGGSLLQRAVAPCACWWAVVRREGRHGGTPPRPFWADKMVATPCTLPSPHPWGLRHWVALSQPWGLPGVVTLVRGPTSLCQQPAVAVLSVSERKTLSLECQNWSVCRNVHTSFLSHTAQIWRCRLGLWLHAGKEGQCGWKPHALAGNFRTCQTMSKMCELELCSGHENGPTSRKPELFHRYFSLA